MTPRQEGRHSYPWRIFAKCTVRQNTVMTYFIQNLKTLLGLDILSTKTDSF